MNALSARNVGLPRSGSSKGGMMCCRGLRRYEARDAFEEGVPAHGSCG